MRGFFDIVGFEYKKILKSKSSVIALALVTIVIAVSSCAIFMNVAYVDGEVHETHYQMMVTDREHALALSGRMVDAGLLAETRDAYALLPAPEERYVGTSAYEEHARPYNQIWRLLRYSWDALDMELVDFLRLSDEQLGDFYQIRHERMAAGIEAMMISDAAKEKLIALDSEIETPFVFTFAEGYDSYVMGIFTKALFGALALAICLAPIFANEYSSGADQLILSSRRGRGTLVGAKIFTALSLTAAYFLWLTVMDLIISEVIYGFDGAGAGSPFQLMTAFSRSVYPLGLLQSMIVTDLNALLGVFLAIALTLFLSAKLRSSFGVIIIITITLFLPMLVQAPLEIPWLYNLYSLIPASIMSPFIIYSHVPFEIFGQVIAPYVFLPLFALAAGALLLWRAKGGFERVII